MSTKTKDVDPPARISVNQPQWFADKFPEESPSRERDGRTSAESKASGVQKDNEVLPMSIIKNPHGKRVSVVSINKNPSIAPLGRRGSVDEKLVAATQNFLELLLKCQNAISAESAEEDIPDESELRLALNAVRDRCVSANRVTIDKECSAVPGSPRPTSSTLSDERVALDCTLGIVFSNALCFEEVPELIAQQSLKSMLDKFKAAQTTGDVQNFQRAILSTVNEILLYTPFDLSRNFERQDNVDPFGETRVIVPQNPLEPIVSQSNSPDRPSGSYARSQDRSVLSTNTNSNFSALRENELKFFGFRNDPDKGNVVIKADQCALWKDYFLNGYAYFLQQHYLLSETESENMCVILPCEFWFNATTAYEQFVHLLLSCFFSRGADVLNHTARVYKLVQYFELHVNWAVDTDLPARPIKIINLDLARHAEEQALDYGSEPSTGEDEMEEVNEADEGAQEEEEEEQVALEQEPEQQEAEPKEEGEYDPDNIVMHFRGKNQSPQRVRSPTPEPEPQVSPQRRHKCYLAGELPPANGPRKGVFVIPNEGEEENKDNYNGDVNPEGVEGESASEAHKSPSASPDQGAIDEDGEKVPVTRVSDGNYNYPEGMMRKSREKK